MSAALHPTCLLWHPQRGGVAKWRGVMRLLTSPPVLNGQPVHAIEYVPIGNSQIAWVQERPIDPRRDLRSDEIERVIDYLQAIGEA